MTAFGGKKRVLALVAQNENQTLANAASGLSGFFSPFGYQTQIIDLLAPDGLAALAAALSSGEVAFAYGFAGIGSQLQDQHGVNIWTALSTPFVAFWYDHPAYNYRQHSVASPYILNCYHIRDHYEVWQRYLPHHNAAIFLPPPAGPNPLAESIPWAARDRRFIFAKTHYNPQQLIASWQGYSAPLRQVLATLIAAAQQDRHLDLAAATEQEFAKLGEPIANFDNFFGVIQTVDHFIRAWRADQLARALRAYPSDIYGRGWDYLAGEPPSHARFHPSFPNSELWPRLTRYRLVANVNPLWREGIHERVMNGIAGGSVVLTDNSERGDSVLGGLPNYIGFEWEVESLQERLALAWERAADGTDYLPASRARLAPLAYTEANFMQPLTAALQALCDRAEAA